MKRQTIIPVVLAGGSGTRLWPLSRRAHPKQFFALSGERTMLQQTLSRLDNFQNINDAIVVCNEEYRFLVAEQLRKIGRKTDTVMLESSGKNTAPAIACAAFKALETNENPLLLVLAADHIIDDIPAFSAAVEAAVELAADDKLLTFGITPRHAAIGYGYIQKGECLGGGYRVRRFLEKPSAERARDFLQTDDYLWNSGMFLFPAKFYLQELKHWRADIFAAAEQAVAGAKTDLDFFRLAPFAENLEAISVDYAVLEKTKNAAVVELDAGWCDIGSWAALWAVSDKDASANVCIGDTLTIRTRNSLVRSQNRLVATIGVSDLIVVESKDAVLVAHKNDAEAVAEVVKNLREKKRPEVEHHPLVFRPWGYFDAIEQSDGFKVKRITVNPGAKLSLQMHRRRAEHWVVVRGEAEVTKGGRTFRLGENESTYIASGEKHALENPTDDILEIIEVQTGDYLEEDDIVRFEDRYGRAEK